MEILELRNFVTYPTVRDGVVVSSVDDKIKSLSEWRRYEFRRGEVNLPQRLLDIIRLNYDVLVKNGRMNHRGGNNVWEYANIWYKDAVYYKGDVSITSDWVFMTNGGGNYAYGSKRCIWETRTWIDRTKHLYSNEASRELGIDNLYLSCPVGVLRDVFSYMVNNCMLKNLISR